jgi:hypothetical protein
MELTKYRIPINPLGTLTCIDFLDFQDYPILTLERSESGQEYISYLTSYLPDGKEQRILASTSAQRLLDLRTGGVTLRSMYDAPSSGPVYAFDVDEQTGTVIDSYIIPLADFHAINPVPPDYSVYCPPSPDKLTGANARALAIAKDRHRVIIELYTEGKALAAGVRPWTISKVFQPFVEIVQKAFDMPEAQFNKLATFPRLAVGSFAATIELDYGPDLFAGAMEYEKFNAVIDLLNARSQNDFHGLVRRFPNEGFIREYLTVINAVRKYDLSVGATLANPMSEQVIEAHLNKDSATGVREVINAVFDVIVDIEDVEGVFLDLDFSVKSPSFAVHPLGEDAVVRGKIDDGLSSRIKADQVNLTSKNYTFSIKTIYQPETSLRPEKTQKWLIDYREVEANAESVDSA